MSALCRNAILWLLMVLSVLAFLFWEDAPGGRLVSDIGAGKIQSVALGHRHVCGTYVGGGGFATSYPVNASLIALLKAKGVPATMDPTCGDSWHMRLLVDWLPLIAFLGLAAMLLHRLPSQIAMAMRSGPSNGFGMARPPRSDPSRNAWSGGAILRLRQGRQRSGKRRRRKFFPTSRPPSL